MHFNVVDYWRRSRFLGGGLILIRFVPVFASPENPYPLFSLLRPGLETPSVLSLPCSLPRPPALPHARLSRRILCPAHPPKCVANLMKLETHRAADSVTTALVSTYNIDSR